MSLALLQGYSSADDDNLDGGDNSFSLSSDEDDDNNHRHRRHRSSFATAAEDDDGVFAHRRQRPNSNSLLPSAFDAFSEVAGPPQFLNSAASGEVPAPTEAVHKRRNRSRDKKDLPAGAVVEAKAQLVGIRDRVRNDIEGNTPTSESIPGDGKRVVSATNPEPKDAADLLRMCLQCGIPKTYSHERGMVCPQCGDRPPPDPKNESDKKKKGAAVKDKEKSKRMKGQSSHATWKSETEMQLRQQFD